MSLNPSLVTYYVTWGVGGEASNPLSLFAHLQESDSDRTDLTGSAED